MLVYEIKDQNLKYVITSMVIMALYSNPNIENVKVSNGLKMHLKNELVLLKVTFGTIG